MGLEQIGMDLGLKGKNIVLFGGQSVIGQEVTKGFAAVGAGVTVVYNRAKEEAEAVVREAKKLGAAWAESVQCDATDYDDTKKVIDLALKRGDLDCIYHGIMIDWLADFWSLPRESWQPQYEVNFKAAMNAWHYALPIMRKAKHGSFINVASTMGRMHPPYEPVYGAMKAALIHLGQNLARQVGPDKVRINFIAPGPTPPDDPAKTPKHGVWYGFAADKEAWKTSTEIWATMSPMIQVGKPVDSIWPCLILASDVAGRHLTGQIIGLDGGCFMPK